MRSIALGDCQRESSTSSSRLRPTKSALYIVMNSVACARVVETILNDPLPLCQEGKRSIVRIGGDRLVAGVRSLKLKRELHLSS